MHMLRNKKRIISLLLICCLLLTLAPMAFAAEEGATIAPLNVPNVPGLVLPLDETNAVANGIILRDFIQATAGMDIVIPNGIFHITGFDIRLQPDQTITGESQAGVRIYDYIERVGNDWPRALFQAATPAFDGSPQATHIELSNLTIIGAEYAGTRPPSMIRLDGLDSAELNNITIETTNARNALLVINCDNVVINDLTITGTVADPVSTIGTGAVVISSSTNVTIDGLHGEISIDPENSDPEFYAFVVLCTVWYATPGWGGPLENVTITDFTATADIPLAIHRFPAGMTLEDALDTIDEIYVEGLPYGVITDTPTKALFPTLEDAVEFAEEENIDEIIGADGEPIDVDDINEMLELAEEGEELLDVVADAIADLNEADFTPESWANLQDALTALEEAIARVEYLMTEATDATEQDILDAIAALEEALDAFPVTLVPVNGGGGWSIGPQPAPPNGGPGGYRFVDVNSGNWFHDAVMFIYNEGLMQGTSDTAFSPNATLTRAMVATILHRLEGEPTSNANHGFADVAGGRWYSDAVAWAAENGIVLGVTETRFAPLNPITREQFAAMLHRYADFAGLDVEVPEGANLDGFTDAYRIGAWAEDYKLWANYNGLITGVTTTTLVPQGHTTRAQAATVLMRFIQMP